MPRPVLHSTGPARVHAVPAMLLVRQFVALPCNAAFILAFVAARTERQAASHPQPPRNPAPPSHGHATDPYAASDWPEAVPPSAPPAIERRPFPPRHSCWPTSIAPVTTVNEAAQLGMAALIALRRRFLPVLPPLGRHGPCLDLQGKRNLHIRVQNLSVNQPCAAQLLPPPARHETLPLVDLELTLRTRVSDRLSATGPVGSLPYRFAPGDHPASRHGPIPRSPKVRTLVQAPA